MCSFDLTNHNGVPQGQAIKYTVKEMASSNSEQLCK